MKDHIMHSSEKIKNTKIWLLRKTNETNRFKVKTWGGFDLTILKVNKSTNKELKYL